MYERLARHVARQAPDPRRQASAVLIPVCIGDGDDRLLYTKRTDTLRSHRGQVCFPGGKRSADDPNLVSTALREAYEEVGIRPEDVEVLGILDDLQTVSGYVITPVVGRIQSPYPYRLNPAEIDALIEVPIKRLFDHGTIELKTHLGPGGLHYNVYSFEADGELIWGATARITRQLVDVLLGQIAPLAPEVVGEDTVDR